jgi:hypothetical protein
MSKAKKVEAMLRELPATAGADPRYAGFFTCFNEQRYFEAHDVLEGLWLETRDPFYKGLIQVAGAFVHLQRQYRNPHHPKHATRTRPAARLLLRAVENLAASRPRRCRLDVDGVSTLCTGLAARIVREGYANPWRPEAAPALILEED